MNHPECQYCQTRFKSVFCDLNEEELCALNTSKGCRTYTKGQVIFNEGAYPHGLFCINEGKAKLSKPGYTGREQIVRLAKDGDILGYRALLSGETYNCSAVALEDSSICFIPKNTFSELVTKNSNLAFELMKLLSVDLKNAENKLLNLAQKPVRERLAEALLFLKETYHFEIDGATLNVILSREEIANIVGTATEVVIRLLSEFKKDKMIAFVGKKIKILNYKELIHAANISD